MFYNGEDSTYNKMFTKGKFYDKKYQGGSSGYISDTDVYVTEASENLGLFMQHKPLPESNRYKCEMFFPTQEDAQKFASFMCGQGEQDIWNYGDCSGDGLDKLCPDYNYKTGDIVFTHEEDYGWKT